MSHAPWHPWREVRGRADITVIPEAEDGLLGSWCSERRTIRLHPALNQRERRCTLAHELVHAERGDTDCHPSVHREAARRLITLGALVRAVEFHGEDWPAVAEELWVDDDTLAVRIGALHPAERGTLERCLAMREATA